MVDLANMIGDVVGGESESDFQRWRRAGPIVLKEVAGQEVEGLGLIQESLVVRVQVLLQVRLRK